MPWLYRSVVKNLQIEHFVIVIYVKWMILTKIADTNDNSGSQQSFDRNNEQQWNRAYYTYLTCFWHYYSTEYEYTIRPTIRTE